MKEWLGGEAEEYVRDGVIVLPYGETVITVRVLEWAGREMVEVAAPLAVGVKPGPGLAKFLLALNAKVGVGRFALYEEGLGGEPTVMYAYTFPEECGRGAFEFALATAMAVVDEYGGEVAELGGGETLSRFLGERGAEED